jgi:predicted dithiol-disulfide oxidoreductase (DUF899 family)
MELPKVVSRDEWLQARKELLAKEKEFTRQRDALSAERRTLPAVRVDKEYEFQGPGGPATLVDLFEGRPQLIVYHFMFDPEWDEGCKSCSYIADNFDGSIPHLAARDTSFAVVSRAPLEKIQAFRKRMGWNFLWLSSHGTDFNYDFHVTAQEGNPNVDYNFAIIPAAVLPAREMPGLSVFLRDGDTVLHTYSAYARGLDLLINTYNYLDLTPMGRHEEGLPWSMAWLNHHDRYSTQATADKS